MQIKIITYMKTILELKSIATFTTKRLLAKKLKANDIDKLIEMHSNLDVMKTLGGLRDENQTLDNLNWNLKQWDDHGVGVWMFYLKETGEWIGRGGIRHVEIDGNIEIEVGYVLLPQFWNQGFATEIAHAAIEVALKILLLDSVVSYTLSTNHASQRVMKKIGFIYERDIILTDQPHVLYRLKNINKSAYKNRDLPSFYQQYLNLSNFSFTAIQHEEAIVAGVYAVSNLADVKYILKICSRLNDYLCENYFLNYFKNKLPVPRIVKTIEATPNTPAAILIEYISGKLLSSFHFTDAICYQMGKYLAKIHNNRTTGYGDLTKPQKLNIEPASYFTFKFEEGIAECREHFPQSLLKKCQQYYSDHIHLLKSVDGPCIVHRDFRPGNLIADEGWLTGIIDWSSARSSFAEEDFCSIVLSEFWNDWAKKSAFLEGYENIRPVPNYEQVLPLLLLSKSIATLGFTVKTQTWDNKNTQLYQRYRKLLQDILK
jgi:RimJ/RimL family protein N-acetyltransferase